MVNVLGQELIERLRQLHPETVHQIAKGHLDALGQHLLRLHRERRDVPVGLEKVQKLAGIGHPERQHLRVLVLVLHNAADQIGDVMQKGGQLVRPLGGLQLGPVVRGGTIAGAQVQRVHRGQLEVWLVDVQLADHLGEKVLLVRLGELEHGGQNGLLAGAARHVAASALRHGCGVRGRIWFEPRAKIR